MESSTANESKVRFGEFIDRAQRGPVQVTRRDRVVGVMVSAQDYDAMRAFYANRLQHTLNAAGEQAAAQGLMPATLNSLVADEG